MTVTTTGIKIWRILISVSAGRIAALAAVLEKCAPDATTAPEKYFMYPKEKHALYMSALKMTRVCPIAESAGQFRVRYG